ncbi:hypothetical protein BBP40_011814 [Aspergillus hancockii]|nr:hypothetical protein BBP40_011814 [Aspergillus hancockii]
MAPTLRCPSRPESVEDLAQRWTAPDRDEKEGAALRALIQRMVEVFQNERKSTYLDEATQLVSVVNEEQYYTLISTFCNAIIEHTQDGNILDTKLLEAFAQALRRKGVLSAETASLGSAMDSLSKRLNYATQRSEVKTQYDLIGTLCTVLDAMVDIRVSGLNRQWLHKPLHDQLDMLRKDPEPRLAQAAAYAYEALRGVPDDESPWRTFRRNSWTIIFASATLASAATHLDPRLFIDAAPDLKELLKVLKKMVDAGQQLYEESQNLKDAFVQTIQGLQKQRLWYGALRYCQLLIEARAFKTLKEIIPNMPFCGGEQFWCGLYAQLEKAWVALGDSQVEIMNFIEWSLNQEWFKSLKKEWRVAQWIKLLAGTMNQPHWEVPIESRRRHSFQFWKKNEPRSKLATLPIKAKILQPLTPELLSDAWQKCEPANRFYADSWLAGHYIKSDQLKIRRLSGEYLSIDHCYINLAVVESTAEIGKHREGSELSLRTRLKIETPQEGKEVQLTEVFDDRPRPDGKIERPKRILIRGRAGVGKTTLCKKIVHDILHHKLWSQRFDRVLWLPLRKLKGRSSLQEFFKEEFFAICKEKELLGQKLWNAAFNGDGRTLFLLDGYDEVAGEQTPSGDLVDFCQGLFDQEYVIITSRPYAVNPYGLNSTFDVELETIGFRPQQVADYVTRVVENDAHIKQIQSFIEGHWLMGDLLQIPIQLDALCFTWGDTLGTNNANTMTALYRAIEMKLWWKDMVQLGRSDARGSLNSVRARNYRLRSQIEQVMGSEVQLLEVLAFNGLYNNVVEFLPEHRDVLYAKFCDLNDSILDGLSFLRSPDSLGGTKQVHYFIHLTFQEFFAANHFGGTQRSLKPEEFIQREKYNGRYNIMWRFVAGLLQAQDKNMKLLSFFQVLDAEPRDLLGPAHPRLLMHCFNELSRLGIDSDEDESVRVWVADALGKQNNLPQDVVKALASALEKDESSLVRREVSFALGRQEALSDSIMIVLEAAVADTGHNVMRNAVSAFCKHSPMTTQMQTILRCHPDKVAATRLLCQYSNYKEKLIQEILTDNGNVYPQVPTFVLPILEENPSLPGGILSSLLLHLGGTDNQASLSAARCLGRQDNLPETVYNDIVSLLRNESSLVRKNAALVLKLQSYLPANAIEVLEELLNDPEDDVKQQVFEILYRQQGLSDTILGAVAQFIEGERALQQAAYKVLENEPTLPLNILEALVLQPDDIMFPYQTARILANQKSLPNSIIESLVLLFEEHPYKREGLLATAQEQDLCCYFLDDILYVDLPERLWEMNASEETQSTPITPIHQPDTKWDCFERKPRLLNPTLVRSCAAYFYSNMLGTVPILHPDAFQEQVDRMDECLHAYCLVAAFCAFVLTQTGYLSCHEHTAPDLGRTLLDEVMAARRHLDPFAAPIRLGIIIAFLLYGCHIGCGNQRQAYYFLREATTFYTADMLDQSADEAHPSFSGKLFWLLLISERAHAIRRRRPVTLQITPNSPTLDSTPSEDTFDLGFRCLVSLYRPFDDSFLSIWNGTQPICTRETLIHLEEHLQRAVPPDIDLPDILLADLRVSQQWLRTMIWQLATTLGFLSSTSTHPSLDFQYPLQIARDLSLATWKLSRESMETHGIGLIEKIFEVACTLTDVMACLSSAGLKSSGFEMGPQDYLKHLCSMVGTLHGGRRRFLPLVMGKIGQTLPAMVQPICRHLGMPELSGGGEGERKELQELDDVDRDLNWAEMSRIGDMTLEIDEMFRL